MADPDESYASIEANFAANVRQHREMGGLSQEELARRMSEHGFGFSQATIWKIEQGMRPVRISEAAALATCLGVTSWATLTAEPEASRHHGQVRQASRYAYDSYAQLKVAAAQYIEAQVNLAFVVRAARDAGAGFFEGWSSWLDIPAERAVIEARLRGEHEEAQAGQIDTAVDQVLDALRQHGYQATIDPADIEWDQPQITDAPGEGSVA